MVSPGSWVLRFEKERKRAWDPSIHPCIHPHSPVQTANQERREQEGGEREEGKVERERHRERETV